MSIRPSVPARACASICVAILLMLSVQAQTQDRAEIDRDVQELRAYKLTMPKVKQMAAATLAYAQAQARKSKLQAQADAARAGDDVEPKTLNDMARRIEREPDLANAIRGAGLTTREYSMVTLSFFNAMFAHGMKKAGTIKELPADILPDNVAFIQSNEAELNQIFAQLQAYDR
jgi:multidrug efflux pump subunit AcrA (membrane-fusion protein)